MKIKIKLSSQVELPTDRQKILTDALSEMPQLCLENITGYGEHMDALANLAAAEEMARDAQLALRITAKQMRDYIKGKVDDRNITFAAHALLHRW